ncbi:MAG: PilZ domain-containing protein [Candidatus Omnitrophica bacterium]|nr:PilZ domain-containing protein [Candidatus Omnitrophota bacterium]
MNKSLIERRGFKRVEAHLPVIYKNMVYITKSCEKGSLSKDISMGGVRLLNDFVAESTKILVEIYLRDDDIPIIAKGVVVWAQKIPFSDRYYVGVRFTEISEASLSRLRLYIERKLSKLAAA